VTEAAAGRVKIKTQGRLQTAVRPDNKKTLRESVVRAVREKLRRRR
jgi:hypothetical protein